MEMKEWVKIFFYDDDNCHWTYKNKTANECRESKRWTVFNSSPDEHKAWIGFAAGRGEFIVTPPIGILCPWGKDWFRTNNHVLRKQTENWLSSNALIWENSLGSQSEALDEAIISPRVSSALRKIVGQLKIWLLQELSLNQLALWWKQIWLA